MNSSTGNAAGLKCRLIDTLPRGSRPGLLVILNHGFGAPGDDLVDFGPWLIDSSAQIAAHCRFVFPEAPVDLAPFGMPGGRAWWPINMAQLAEINQTRDFEQLTTLQPEGMVAASRQLADAVSALQLAAGLDDTRTVLGGFSQGAMVSTDAVLRHRICPRLLALFSGTLLCRDEWSSLAADHPGCRVFQSHGRQDPLLPLEPAIQLSQLLSESGFSVEFSDFFGPHTIPLPVLERLAGLLDELLQDQ